MSNEAQETKGSGTRRGRVLRALRAHPAMTILAIAAIATAAAVLLPKWYVSETARLMQTMDAACAGLLQGDVAATLDNVSPYFSEGSLDKGRLGRYMQRALRGRPIQGASFVVRQVDFGKGTAEARIHVRSQHGPGPRGIARSEWRIGFEKLQGRWFIASATPLLVNGKRVAGLSSVLALGYWGRP